MKGEVQACLRCVAVLPAHSQGRRDCQRSRPGAPRLSLLPLHPAAELRCGRPHGQLLRLASWLSRMRPWPRRACTPAALWLQRRGSCWCVTMPSSLASSMYGSSSLRTKCWCPGTATSTTRSGAPPGAGCSGHARSRGGPCVSCPREKQSRQWFTESGGSSKFCDWQNVTLFSSACWRSSRCAARLLTMLSMRSLHLHPLFGPPPAATGLSMCWKRASQIGCDSGACTRSRSTSRCTAAAARSTPTLRTTTPAVRGQGHRAGLVG